jgi:hypothetical protein
VFVLLVLLIPALALIASLLLDDPDDDEVFFNGGAVTAQKLLLLNLLLLEDRFFFEMSPLALDVDADVDEDGVALYSVRLETPGSLIPKDIGRPIAPHPTSDLLFLCGSPWLLKLDLSRGPALVCGLRGVFALADEELLPIWLCIPPSPL